MARKWTDEQRKAQGERLAAARAAKAAKQENGMVETPIEGMREQAPQPTEAPATDPGIAELTKMVLELQQKLAEKEANSDANTLAEAIRALAGGNGAQVSRGKLVGTTQKHDTNLKLYPDPTKRLAEEPRLKRIAFDTNYELEFSSSVTRYETKDGLNMEEPKFQLKLIQVILDENGDPTNQRMGKAQMIFFEDPATATEVANRLGLPIDETNELDFLNEMRYMRMREWLFECFWPGKKDNGKGDTREMVVNGQVVQVWEVSSENSAKIPFDKLEKFNS